MLLTSLHGHKLQFISLKLCPLSSLHGQLHELVFFPCTEALIFLEHHTRLFVEWAIWALLFASLMTTMLLQSLNKMHLKQVFLTSSEWYVFHESKNTFIKFQKQLFADVFQKRCSLKSCNSHRKTPVLELLFN